MRLSKVKLAGFKSFVDPTTLQFSSDLIGIVGPNGCGKSNIIDAVRWVMGESSAKHLRGDSMADVIFNGSNSRKPVGHASIELVFDNTDGSAGGQYASYNEIAIRRQVSRDGQSVYFLNGTRCRRRDITDIFLGTGLGPRSYSIIEQGMISRLIEAKPEDLRVFLEEAAGISKYKERRRETENRIRHTRENLDRLTDLREEIAKQIERLQRQAKAAEKYKELKQEERRVKAELLALRYQALHAETEHREKEIREQETALESLIADQRALEAAIEKDREASVEANDGFNTVQGRFYELGAEIARVEQAIQHSRQTRQAQQEELDRAEKAWAEAQSHIGTDTSRLETLAAEIGEVEPSLERARHAEQTSRDALQKAEQDMQAWQTAWEGFNRDSAEAAQKAQVERTRIDHLDRQLNQLAERLERIAREQQVLADGALENEIGQLTGEVEDSASASAELQASLDAGARRVTELRNEIQANADKADETRSRLEEMRGRLASLEALQQAALGQESGEVTEWLAGQGFADAPRLAKELEVEPGWEKAVETVLGFYLEAVCVDGADHASVLGTLEHGSVAFVERDDADASSPAEALVSRVRSPWDVQGLLAGVRVAESLADALRIRQGLQVGESVVTRDGLWFGRGWMRVARDADEKTGVLEREKEIQSLTIEVEKESELYSGLRERLETARRALREAEEHRDQIQERLTGAHRAEGELRARLSGLNARLEQVRRRTEAMEQEAGDLRAQRARDADELQAARQALQGFLTRMEQLADERGRREGEREDLLKALDQARTRAHEARQAAQELAIRIESLRTAETTTRQNLERMHAQQVHLRQRREHLQQAIADAEAPIKSLTEELNRFLERRVEVENELSAARQHVEAVDTALRSHERERNEKEHAIEAKRAAINEARMTWQEIKVRGDTVLEQLSETGLALEALLEEMAEDADVATWEAEVERYANRIQRLGAINLAAIEEFEEQSQRKVYLDAQFEDVSEALATLENAILKIDKETRTRFKETFDKVNAGLQAMFPRLFGGGHAYLELTGEDLLDTGVTVMARPPGKRNSTIHLLSGGEKALTAVALVFAIFELNPAPFCLLDEVDAPLDDANVGRFCDMVREMSQRVQFIFITHNKITMELADQLSGVTMSEPGVSRLVSVDVDEAVQLAAV